MLPIPVELNRLLNEYQQTHLLLGYDTLTENEQRAYLEQLQKVNYEQLEKLFSKRDQTVDLLTEQRLRPIPSEPVGKISDTTTEIGRRSLRKGEVAVLLVAGGQGTRLGFDKPKGMFPIGPISNKTLFQIHAEKILALSKKYGKTIPFLLMTSPATHEDTIENFEKNNYFGLPKSEVFFFQQGTMPALDLLTGKILLEKKGQLFLSPNGHGGTLMALKDSGLLEQLKSRGIKHLFYFQVDNPLVTIADPRFLGRHIEVQSQASSKSIAKAFPDEKMGVFALLDGKCTIIEYSDMPKNLKHATHPNGALLYPSGSPAIHLFDLEFLESLTKQGTGLPFHLAKKKVPHIDSVGNPVTPTSENALKFEMFIFDALPLAKKWLIVESPRAEEFAPVKNAEGVDSPATCRDALIHLYASWLEKNGLSIPRDAHGKPLYPIEISPLVALEPDDLKGRINPSIHLNEPMYLK